MNWYVMSWNMTQKGESEKGKYHMVNEDKMVWFLSAEFLELCHKVHWLKLDRIAPCLSGHKYELHPAIATSQRRQRWQYTH
jgi:hypothetical protein